MELKTLTEFIFYLILHVDEVAEVRGCTSEAICTTMANGVKTEEFRNSLRQFLINQGVDTTIYADAEDGGWVVLLILFFCFKEMKWAYLKRY